MTKNEAYNALLERVQRADGYISFGAKERPVVVTNEGRKRQAACGVQLQRKNGKSCRLSVEVH